MSCKFLTYLILLALNLKVYASAPLKQNKDEKSAVQRVAGEYRISSIKKSQYGQLIVFFESIVKTGKYDYLFLECDTLHGRIETGSVLRISAELLNSKEKDLSEISQVLVFLRSEQTKIPVWLLSRKAQFRELRGQRGYLEMHAPTSDYQVF